ncbi:MAG: TolC family outer membrane protein [Moritella sp.]|uniref:TolC family outer membrane protein n=1 Tax=Moritella sp. TaxID=78556 RepID=UPI001D88A579|nr:TolC family outer membrane protein [Moritella sp.]NQZ51020.1 TolC family outer membrane protein [Moritella sp.]
MPSHDSFCQLKLFTKGLLYPALMCSAIGWSAVANAQSVEEAVAMTLSSHPDIRIAFTKFKVREQQVQQAEAGYLPSLNVTGGYGYEYTNSPGTRRSTDGGDSESLNRGEFGISLKQSLFSGFQTSSDISRTSYAASAEQWRLFSTAEDVALDVTKVYTNLLKSRRILELSKRNLSTHKTIFGQIQERTNSGLGSIADLSQITGRLARAQSNVIAAKNNYLDSEAQFLRVTDQLPDNLVIPIPDVALLPTDRQAGLRTALINHPVVKSSNNDIISARYQHDAAKSNYYPKVTFEVDANFNNDLDGEDGHNGISGVGGHNNDVVAMVRFSYNLYSGGKDKALAKETAYKITEANEINRSVHRQITEGFTLAWNAHELLNLQMRYIKEHVIASKDSQAAYEQQFKLGQRSLLDLLDTENELFEARKEYVGAEFNEIVTQYRLLNATGQLLDSLRVTRPAVWQGEHQYAGGVQ